MIRVVQTSSVSRICTRVHGMWLRPGPFQHVAIRSTSTSRGDDGSGFEDSGSLIPSQPGTPIYRRQVQTAPPQESMRHMLPTSPPFGLMLNDTCGLDREFLLSVFEPIRCSDVKLIDAKKAHLFFETREDMLHALAMSNSPDIRFMTLLPSPRLHNLALCGDTPPFRAHLSNLPPGAARVGLLQLFKDCSPESCVMIPNKDIAFMSFSKKNHILRAMDLSGTTAVQGILVNPAYPSRKFRP